MWIIVDKSSVQGSGGLHLHCQLIGILIDILV